VQVYRDWSEVPKRARAITIGVFDGVHQGHRTLLRQLLSAARERNLGALVVTFANHPQSVLNPPAPPLLTSPEERLQLLAEIGVPETLLLAFTPELAHQTAEQFCQELVDKLGCHLLIVGDDFALGYRREGTVPRLRELGRQLGFEVTTVPSFTLKGVRVSSSHIRQLLLQGQLVEAQELLGAPYLVAGKVTRGAGRGHHLGFPTINLQVPPEKLLPRHGVYAGRVRLLEGRWDAAVYIGKRPTFGETEPIVEAYLLDFRGEVRVGTQVTVELLAFIRPDQRFETAEALVAQMQEDVEKVRECLREQTS